MTPRCQWQGCPAAATCSVNAQWSWFDFLDYLACDEHSLDIAEGLFQRRVDGKLPIDVWRNWFDQPEP